MKLNSINFILVLISVICMILLVLVLHVSIGLAMSWLVAIAALYYLFRSLIS